MPVSKPVQVLQKEPQPIFMIIQPNAGLNNTYNVIQNNNIRPLMHYNLIQSNNSLPHFMPYNHNNKNPSNRSEPALPNNYILIQRDNIRLNQINCTKNENAITGYKNPFDYSTIDSNMLRSFAERKIKRLEKELTEKDITNWICMVCGNEYQAKSALINHYGVHKQVADQLEDNNDSDEGISIVCPVCDCHFTNVATYFGHVDVKHKPKNHTCEICKKCFSNNYNLSIHMQQHSNESSNKISCIVCKNFSTVSSSDLANHILSQHDKYLFYCDECGKDFISETWFNDHKIFHIKSKKFHCDKCNVHCRNQMSFIVHMRKAHKINLDAKVKKVKCTGCDLTFAKEENLKSHNRCVHTHANAFLCNVCGQGFAMKANLTLHMKIHGEAEYICSTCGKGFKQQKSLVMHSRTHTGKKPHKCHICEKCFTQKSTLNVHLRIHSGERPYVCGKCKNGFITKTIRDTHQKSCKK